MREEEGAARSYRDLNVWRKAIDLAESAYRLTRAMPKAASVPANIAEGNARGTRKDYTHFISIARGSVAEVETFLILIRRLELAPVADIDRVMEQADEISRMPNALRARLAEPRP